MKTILFLARKQMKNQLVEMIRHPARLIMYVALIALLGFSLFSSGGHRSNREYLDFRILDGIYLGFMLIIAVPSILIGLKSGTTFFKMSDVNFLFVSPLSPKKILAYGLIKQMASTVLMMFFLLFYGGMAANTFGVTPIQIVFLVLGVAIMVFTIQIMTLLIYTYTSGRPERVRLVKIGLYGIICLVVAYIFGSFLLSGSKIEAALAAISSPYLEFVPIAGWIKGMIFGIIKGNTANVILYALLNIIAIVGSILLFVNSNSDYYEDVLESTESGFERKAAIKEGRSSGFNSKKAKVTDTGINHGWGANTFFFKHLRQNKRQSPVPFIGVSTLVLMAINIILVIFLRAVSGSGSDRMPADMLMTVAVSVSCYILFLFNATGDWILELKMPYIYLIPAKPFQTLVWACLSTVMKPVIDGVLIFGVLCVILQASPATALLCTMMYASTGFLFTAGNVLSQRLLGQVVNKGLMTFLYMLVLLVLLAPGIGMSVGLSIVFTELPYFAVWLPAVVWNILVSLGVFAACRNILSTSELNE